MLVRLTVPAVRTTLPVTELEANVPPRFSVPVESTWITSEAPLEDQLPAVVSVPVLAHSLPLLVQLVPLTVMTRPLVSALMVPWLASPSAAVPTKPLCVPCTRMLAPMSSVEPTSLGRSTPLVLVPPKTISPVPLRNWLPVPRNTISDTLPCEAMVTLPLASTRPPEAMFRKVLLLTTTSPASVTPLSVAVPETTVALVPALVTIVAFWIWLPLPSDRFPP